MDTLAMGKGSGVSLDELELLDFLLDEDNLAVPAAEVIPRRADQGDPRCSFVQERLWFLDQLQANNPAYNIASALELSGDLDVAALRASLTLIVARHEIMRTSFRPGPEGPLQQIAPPMACQLPCVDLSATPPDELMELVRQHALAEAQRPFDLATAPLFRATLLKLGATRHVLLLTLHHIITDGWSVGVLLRELITAYEALQAGREVALPALPLQYADYADWQRQRMQGELLDQQLDYWKRQLAGAPALVDLPLDRPRPAVQTSRGAMLPFQLPEALGQRLQRLCLDEDATLFMTLQTAFAVLLARYSRQDDILIGTPIAGRVHADLEGLLGAFLNTLVVRTDLSGNPSFRELLRRVRETTLEGYAHQDVPFEKVVETVQPERDLSHTPLFQVVFVLQNTPLPDVGLSGLTIRPLALDSGIAKFDLTLAITPQGNQLSGYLEYNADLFDQATISRMADHYRVLLEAIVADPGQAVEALPLLTSAERQQILERAVPAAPVALRPGSIHQRFEAMAAQHPEAIAAVYEGQRLSYGELNARANQLAHHLRGRGVGPNVLVGLCCERSLEMVVGILGVLKAGGAYVPLDPAYPAERLAFMLEDAQVPVLVTQSHLLPTLPTAGVELVVLDDAQSAIRLQPEHNPADELVDGQLAYVIYTSGSTGKPKGVLIPHANVLALLDSTQPWFEFDERDVWTLFHSYAFDFSVWELWGALTYGGCLVVVPFLVSRSPDAFLALLRAERVTVLNQTPSAFLQLMAADEALGGAPDLALRYVIFGGEALEPKRLAPWFERHGAVRPRLVNMYGITETTVHVTYRPIARADVGANASVIGVPIPNWELYVLDQHGQPVPDGVPGELYVGGAGVAVGYLNRAQLSAERFIDHPFGRPGKLYRSGDLARRLASGDLEYLGRIDHQVKVRGFRIELEEIAAVLLQHPAVRDSVVLARPTGGETRLVAYVVGEAEQAPQIGELRAHVQSKLPGYMVPAAFVVLEAFPLTANGKLDRRALPEPDVARPELSEAYVMPRTPVEAALAEIWAQVLGLERVGVHDNFFALGGDSIRSIRVVSQARERGLEVTLQQLFQHQSVAGLAEQLGAAAGEALPTARSAPFSLISAEDRAALPPGVVDAYPLTALQAGMLYHMHSMPDDPVYHNVDSHYLRGRLHSDYFQQALRLVVARHPILRTSFDLTGFSEPLQLVHAEPAIAYYEEDIRHLDHEEQERVVQVYAEREVARRFDLARPPLIRFAVHRRTEDTFQLTLTEFHPILDGWSLHTIIAEVFGCHFALLDQGHPDLPPPVEGAFRDFVRLEREATEQEESQRFWERQLCDARRMRLPRWPAETRQRGERRVAGLTIPIPQHQALQQVANAVGVPLKSLFLATHLRVMSLLGGGDDVLTGIASNGRLEEGDSDRVCGLFLNTLPIRLRLPGGSWRELLQQTFAAECAILPHRRYPLAALQKRWGGTEPFFEAAFNYLNFHIVGDLFQSRNLEHLSSPALTEETSFTLQSHFVFRPSPNDFILQLDYDSAEISPAQAEAIAAYYLAVLDAIARDVDARYEQATLLPAAEQALLAGWNSIQGDYPAETIQALFEAQARRAPEAIAVSCEDQHVSYGELNARANQLAHRLRALGVGPEVLVGVYLERGPDLIVAILGILKAGGAYLPLDLSYPGERLAFILADAQAPLLVTDSRLAAQLPAQSAALLCLDRDGPAIALEPTDNPPGLSTSDQLAYVIYTSGSTGKPKGSMIPHAHVARLFSATDHWFQFGERDVWTLFHSIAFDFSVWELWGALLYGGRLVIVPYLLSRDPDAFYALLEREQVTVLNQTPSAFRQLIRAEEEHAGLAAQRELALRLVIFGGEALELQSLRPWFERHGDERPQLVNMYGITETTVHVTYRPLTMADLDGAAGSVIGQAIPDLSLHVLDQHGQPVPIGVAGELYVGGAGLARAYLGRPALTAERFIPSPYAGEAGQRLYKTGDLARYLPDGELEYLGRIDHQVKIRGFRIELGEIEAALGAHPLVRECVVLVREDRPGDRRLVAYVVPRESETLTPKALREHLKPRLPEYMLPAACVILERFPLTVNGKLDRRLLPAPEQLAVEAEQAHAAPRTPLEAQLAAIWAEVLQRRQVGVHENFFELGGDSLLTLRVVTRAAQAGLRLTTRQLLLHPTVAELAALLEPLASVGPEQGLVSGDVPLTPNQHWFLGRGLARPQQWNITRLLEAPVPLRPELLAEALRQLLAHHDALRTRFLHEGDGWRQLIALPSKELPFSLIDLDGQSEAAQRAEIERHAGHLQQSLDLANGPLLRLAYFHLGAARPGIVLVIIHHLVCDALSFDLVLEDLQLAYHQLSQGRPVQLPPKTSSYKDWGEHLVAYARSEEMQLKELDYWCGLPWQQTVGLPLDYADGRERNLAGSTRLLRDALGAEDTSLLLRQVRDLPQTQLLEVLLAALGRTISRWSGSPLVASTLIINGRESLVDDVDVSRTVGFFALGLPLLLDVPAQADEQAALEAVQQQLRAVPNRGTTFGVLYRMCGPAMTEALEAQIDRREIVINYLGGEGGGAPQGPALLRPVEQAAGSPENPENRRDFLLQCNIFVANGELTLLWDYSANAHERATIERLSAATLETLRAWARSQAAASR